MNQLEHITIGHVQFDVKSWPRVQLDFTQDGHVVLYNGSACVHKYKIDSNTRVNLKTIYGNFLYREKHYSQRSRHEAEQIKEVNELDNPPTTEGE